MTYLQYEYWPPLSWMHQFYNSGTVTLIPYGNYQKQSLFNRCHIVGRGGPLTLSVPLKGGREQKTTIAAVQIDNSQRWAVQQLRTLRSCYGKAPFFNYYFPQIESLLSRQHTYMLELNETILQQIIRWTGWKGTLETSTTFIPATDITTIGIVKPYVQVFAGSVSFIPNLSILDGLFCLGPALPDYFVE